MHIQQLTDQDELVAVPATVWRADEPVAIDFVGGNTIIEYLAPGSRIEVLAEEAVIGQADGVWIDEVRGDAHIKLLDGGSHIKLLTDLARVHLVDNARIDRVAGQAVIDYCTGEIQQACGQAVVHLGTEGWVHSRTGQATIIDNEHEEATAQHWLGANGVEVDSAGCVTLWFSSGEPLQAGVVLAPVPLGVDGAKAPGAAPVRRWEGWSSRVRAARAHGAASCVMPIRVRVEDLVGGWSIDCGVGFRSAVVL